MKKIRMRFLIQFLGMAAILLQGLEAKAVVFEILEPAGDKYIYPFITDPTFGGDRDYASTFGAYGALDNIPGYDFDDRDAQFFLDFSTASLVAPGQGASNYQLTSLEIWVVVANNGSFFFDSSADPLSTYQNPESDSDLGRPIEMYGVGYRGGFTQTTFSQDSPFGPAGSIYKNVRNAYAIDFGGDGNPRDVSNNVEEGFTPNPWAIADAPGSIDVDGNYIASPLPAGSTVPEGTVFRFQLNLTDPKVRTYVQEGLHAGRIHLMVSSLYNATQQSSDIPKFYTKESGFHIPSAGIYLAPRLYAEVTLAPAGAPPVPKVSVSRLNPSGFRVSFETQTGYQYFVESRDSLASGNWTAKSTTFTGNGGTQFFDDTEANLPASRFYRVAVTANKP